MPFRNDSKLDTSQVEDRRGTSIGKGAAIGGGGLTIIIMVVALLLGVNPAALEGVTSQMSAGQAEQIDNPSTGGNLLDECRTGADANTRQDCRVVGYVNSIQAFWTSEFVRQGSRYKPAKTQIFTDATQGACGYASAASGPFYCPRDQKVYLDLAFFEELQKRFGAKGGPFAEAYVLSHEYGHHVQNLAGVLDDSKGASASGPQSMSVRIELQADCLAGVWVHHAAATGYLTQPTEAEISQALDTASAVGDDRIQKQTQGRISPESWTHGSAAQRQRWFKKGLETGEMTACDTSSGPI
jgi:hypothetical protein